MKQKSCTSSYASKKATLSNIPASVDRHRNSKMTPVKGKAMRGGKIKK